MRELARTATTPTHVGETTRRAAWSRRRGPELTPTRGVNTLRLTLMACDFVSGSVAWLVPWIVLRTAGLPLWFVPMQGAAVVVFNSRQRLYLARVCAVRAVEMARLGRVAVRVTIGGGLVMWALETPHPVRALFVGMALTFLFTTLARGGYRSVMMRRRRAGLNLRPIIVVGTDAAAASLVHHIERHPAFGYRVVGVVGDPVQHRDHAIEAPFLGAVTNTIELALRVGANGVIVADNSAPVEERSRLLRDMLDARLHVQIMSGLRGFAQERVITHDIAYEPLLYLEPAQLSRAEHFAKRALDLIVAPALLLLTLPIAIAIAVAIKVTSPGPVLFTQQRVGFHGRTFRIYKFRTMCADAEQQAAALADQNLRDGPLFKIEDDPRVTGIGRMLRATSLDELPQLLNIVNGTMTLVGPRPALEREVAEFDDELLRRFSVRPGVTGLWQLEARDDPDFETYRRLDLFYVENWSLSLDLAILIGTASDVVVRAVEGATGRHSGT